MTSTPVDADARIAQDPQRQLLQQLATLSVQCARQEQQIEAEHAGRTAEHKKRVDLARSQNQQKRNRNIETLERRRQDLLTRIEEKYAADCLSLDAQTTQARTGAEQDKQVVEEQVRKQVEQARWLAESVLEAVQTQLEVEARDAHQEHAARLAEVTQLQQSAIATLSRYEQPAMAFQPLAGGELAGALAQRPDELFLQHKQKAEQLLAELGDLSTPRLVAGGAPYLVTVMVSVVLAAAAWFLFSDGNRKLIGSAVAATLGVIGCAIATVQLKRRAAAELAATYVPLAQSLELARRAADGSLALGDKERQAREMEQRRTCAREVDAARDQGKPIQRGAAERYARTMAEIDARHADMKQKLERWRDEKLAELRQQHAAAVEAAEHAFQHESQRTDGEDQSQSQGIENDYDQQTRALQQRWSSELTRLAGSLTIADRNVLVPLDWNDPVWADWTSPRQISSAVPFGSLRIDLLNLTSHAPQRLQLPEAFAIPAVLAFPNRGSLLIETDHAGRAHALSTASMVMSRLLTHMPAGRVKFTIIDPVGLGQSFAGFMHLADHDESLVGSRIWTETEHIEQRLADLTEHMETVIQKYLRNEYQTIDQYNAQAGELAEPLRYLVIADFPIGLEQESLRRLASIATSGARCGVHTIIIRDARQALPQNSHYEELLARSIVLQFAEGKVTWKDEVFAKFPLSLDPAPDEKTLTVLMDRVGRAAREAKRVEVPFSTIAPADGDFWSVSSRDELRVAIGKSGATRLQSLRLGVGVAQHALVAGKTGSGKSNLMHTIITNLAMWYSPDEVEFYLVDFKKGVEFKAYVSRQLPHARAIAVESDREFGLSVLQRVDAELTRRGELFRSAGVQEISAYRQTTGQVMPRTLLLIDEFQEFFSEDDKLAQEAAILLDRLVRQGRAFGVHVVLGSQTIGGSSGLSRSTLGQMAVRVALQCSEADSQMILGDNNSAARLLSRPGEAIYNDAGGLVEANSPFQIAFLPDEQRDQFLRRVQELAARRIGEVRAPVVFEGNAPADIRKNTRLMALLAQPAWQRQTQTLPVWIGEPVSIKEPTAVSFRPQSGSNVLMVGQQEELALAIMSSMMVSIALQQPPEAARFILLDGTAADSPLAGTLQKTADVLPHSSDVVAYRKVEEVFAGLEAELDAREADTEAHHPPLFVFIFAMQRYRMLRRQEESFGFSNPEEEKPRPDKTLARLITDGPPLAMHVVTWSDTAVTLDRTFDRGVLREFDHRILFQMSATDSSNLIDSPLANKLGTFRALAYSEELGTVEKFRPYQLPDEAWLTAVRTALSGG